MPSRRGVPHASICRWGARGPRLRNHAPGGNVGVLGWRRADLMMRSVSRAIASGSVGLLLIGMAGCSGSDGSGRATGGAGGDTASGGADGSGGAAPDGSTGSPFPSAPLSTFMTPSKDLRIELRTAPLQPIHVGPDGEGELRVFDAASGDPVDGLRIAVTSWMPVMGHKCSELPIKVKPEGQGAYLLTPLVGSMKGKCELELTLSMPLPDGGKAEPTAVVSPTFDVAK